MGRRVLVPAGPVSLGVTPALCCWNRATSLWCSAASTTAVQKRYCVYKSWRVQLTLVEGDVRKATVDQAFSAAGAIDGGSFRRPQSRWGIIENPLLYWDVNLNGSRVLAAAMGAWLPNSRVQQHVHRLRRTRNLPAAGNHANGASSPLRPDQSGGEQVGSPLPLWLLASGMPPLFQSCRRTPSGESVKTRWSS